jgi:hypothetical protein
MDPAAEKAQQEPHCPWSFIGEKTDPYGVAVGEVQSTADEEELEVGVAVGFTDGAEGFLVLVGDALVGFAVGAALEG